MIERYDKRDESQHSTIERIDLAAILAIILGQSPLFLLQNLFSKGFQVISKSIHH